jgi:hypothetical protein
MTQLESDHATIKTENKALMNSLTVTQSTYKDLALTKGIEIENLQGDLQDYKQKLQQCQMQLSKQNQDYD